MNKLNDNVLLDEITISWHFTDVQEQCPHLSNTDAKRVLQVLKRYHDANIGINWEVIDATVEAMGL